MENKEPRERYSLEQFGEATEYLASILAACGFGEIDACMVVDYEVEPRGSAIKELGPAGHVAAHIHLQDDGGEPYAVVDLCRYMGSRYARRTKGWHAAYVSLTVSNLYPHQFKRIPEAVRFLEERDVPWHFLDLSDRE